VGTYSLSRKIGIARLAGEVSKLQKREGLSTRIGMLFV
jgi:hypothetical protein